MVNNIENIKASYKGYLKFASVKGLNKYIN